MSTDDDSLLQFDEPEAPAAIGQRAEASDPDLAWYCVRTPTKREHFAAAFLREIEGVEVFSPRLRYRKATRRGKVWWVEALFPGYVLARFNLIEMSRAVRYAPGVSGLVHFREKVPKVSDAFVEELRRELALNPDPERPETITVQPSLSVGDEVEIAHGPLQGFRGPIIHVLPGSERVRILLEFLGGDKPIDVDLFSIILPKRPTP
jgi:transcriptional antiterminator RfaH